MDHYEYWLTHYGYAGIFLGLVLGIVGLPIPDETLLTFSGYLVYRGEFALLPTCAVAFLGSACGITVSYTLGRVLGVRLGGRLGHFLHVTPKSLERVHAWFERSGRWLLVFGYFIPGVRHLTAIVAGSSRLDLRAFALFAYAGALLWSLTFIAIGYFFGGEWNQILQGISHHRPLGLAVTAVALLVLFALHRWSRRDRASRSPPEN
jgi:membrane protein DedA with SNARE-associated domain